MLHSMINHSNMCSGLADARRKNWPAIQSLGELSPAGRGSLRLEPETTTMPLARHQGNSTMARHQKNSKLNFNRKSVDCRGHLGRIHVTASRWTETSQGTGCWPISGVNGRPDSEPRH